MISTIIFIVIALLFISAAFVVIGDGEEYAVLPFALLIAVTFMGMSTYSTYKTNVYLCSVDATKVHTDIKTNNSHTLLVERGDGTIETMTFNSMEDDYMISKGYVPVIETYKGQVSFLWTSDKVETRVKLVKPPSKDTKEQL